MSWSSRFTNLGRFSPFTRSPPRGSATVSDADFSYITADDLKRHQADSAPDANSQDRGPSRDTDVLRIRDKRNEHAIHFPAYSIVDGELTVGQLRAQVAKKVSTGDRRRIKLTFRGKTLRDDTRTCRQEGLRHDAELLCSTVDAMSPDDSEDDDDDDEVTDSLDDNINANGEPKKRRNRGKRTKRRNKREERDQPGRGSPLVHENLGVPGSSQQPSRTQSPRPAPMPTTPIGKLDALHDTLQTFIPGVQAYLSSPPADPAKREFEYKKLSETILAQVLIKIDAVEVEGDPDARARRKELVKETQKVLNDLDAAKS